MKLKRLVDPAFVVTTSHNAFTGHCFRAKVVYILQHFGSRQKHCFRLVGRFTHSSARGAIFFPTADLMRIPRVKFGRIIGIDPLFSLLL